MDKIDKKLSVKRMRDESRTPPRRPVEGVGFKVKPLNDPTTVPRMQWSQHKEKKAQKELGDVLDLVQAVDSLDIAQNRLDRYVEKIRDEKLKAKADRIGLLKGKTGPRLVTQSTATRILSPKKRKRVTKQKESQCDKTIRDRIEPQMFGLSMPGSFPVNIALEPDTLDLGENVVSVGKEFVEAVKGLTDSLKSTQHGVQFDITAPVSKALSNLGDFGLFLLVSVILLMMKPQSAKERAYALSLVTVLLATRFDLMQIVERSGLMSFFQKADQNVPQDGLFPGEEFDINTVVVSMINMYLYANVGKELIDPKEFLKVSSQMSRSTPTVVATLSGVKMIVGFLTRCAHKFITGDELLSSGYPFIDAYWKEYKDIVDLWESKELYNRQESVDRVKAHIALGENTMMRLPGGNPYGSIRMAMLESVRQLERIRTALMSSNFRYSGHRPEPVSMLLLGRPGVFKSQAMQHVANAIHARILSPEDYARYRESPTSWSHNRQAENVYWDGYTMDKVVVFFDDLFQARDVQGNPDNEAMNVIRAINIFEYKLHMAQLQDKGNTNFRSKFVIANSNMEAFNLDSINEIGAFMRRWDIVVRVVPQAQYCKNPYAMPQDRVFDPEKFPVHTAETCRGVTELIGTTRTDPAMCEFHLMGYDPRRSPNSFVDLNLDGCKSVFSFDEMVERYVDFYKKKVRYDTSYNITLEDTLDRHRAIYEQMKNEPQSTRGFNSTGWDERSFEEELIDFRGSCKADYRFSPALEKLRGSVAVDFLYYMAHEVRFKDYNENSIFQFWQHVEDAISYVLDTGELFSFEHSPLPRITGRFIEKLKNRLFDTCDLVCDGGPTPESWLVTGSSRVAPGSIVLSIAGSCPPDFDVSELVNDIRLCGEYWLDYVLFFYKRTILIDGSSFGERDALCFEWFVALLEVAVAEVLEEMDFSFSDPDLAFEHLLTVDVALAIVNRLVELARGRIIGFGSIMDLPRTDFQIEPQVMRSSVAKETATLAAFRQQFTLSEDRERELVHLKHTQLNKYLLVYHGFLILMHDAFLGQDRSLIPDFAFDAVNAVVTKAMSDYIHGDDLDVEKVACHAQLEYSNLAVEKCFQPSTIEPLMRSLSETFEKNQHTPTSRLWDLYIKGLCWLSASEYPVDDLQLSPVLRSNVLKRISSYAAITMSAFWVGMKTVGIVSRLLFPSGPESNERHAKVRKGRILRRPKVNRPEAALTTNEKLKSAKKMLYNNSMYSIYLPLPKDERDETKEIYRAGNCLAVAGRCLMMPWHFWSSVGSFLADKVIDPMDQVVMYNNNKQRVFQLSAQEFYECAVLYDEGEKRDLIIIKLPRHFQPVRNVAKHFATEKQHQKYTKVDAALCIPSVDDVEAQNYMFKARSVSHRDIDSDDYESFRITGIYEYDASTTSGDCGSLLFADDVVGNGSIIGMHVAGCPGKRVGFSASISREFVEDYLKFAGETYIVEEPDTVVLEPSGESVTTMRTLGKVAPESGVPGRQVGTSLRESVLKDRVKKSPNKPARLGPYKVDDKWVDPMDHARSGYCPSFTPVDSEMVKRASVAFFDHLNHVSESVPKNIMTFEESVLGDGPGSEFGPIPRDTSAGYPYNCGSGIKSKKLFFGDGEEYDLNTPACLQLRNEVCRIENRAREGVRCLHVFTDSLKDERRPIEKVEAGKTRMFSGCPTPLLILTRMYFGAFAKFIIKNRIENGISIGVNEYSSEWDLIARRLQRYGSIDNVGAGDFSGLDKNELPIFHIHLLDRINEWYDDGSENAQIRSILLLELTNSIHINMGVLFEWPMSMPSGHFLTALFNSCTVQLLFRCVFEMALSEKGFHAHDFDEFVYLIVLGDDNVYCVHPRLRPFLNEVEVGRLMKKLGQTYTPEDKLSGVHTSAMRRLEEVSFLKRRWYLHEATVPKRYMAPLDLDTVLDILNWVKKGGNRYGDTEVNVDTVLHELTLHGRAVFLRWLKEIMVAINEVPGLQKPKVTSFDVLFRDVLRRDGWEFNTLRRFKLDYDDLDVNSVVNEVQSGRLLGGRGGLFRPYVTRVPRWQPQQNPGSHGNTVRLPYQTSMYQQGANSKIEEVPGESTEGIFQTTRVENGQSDVQVGTTKSYAETGVVKTTPNYVPLRSELLASARSGANVELKDFLARPVLVFSGTFATTNTHANALWEYRVPYDFLQLDIWKNKLQGILAFRGTLHLTIQINGNRFQQGRYMMCWVPTGGAVNTAPARTHHATLTESTQCPHVEFDIACDTEATLVIPMVNAQGWCPTFINGNSLFGQVGYVRCVPYSPLVAPTGSTSCFYSLYAHWEDVDIAMPVVPQSGRAGVRTKIKRRPTVAEKEQDSGGIGPIEAAATTIGTLSQQLTGVPLLASVAAPVGWAADIVKHVAAAYGWSKPRNMSPQNYVSFQQMFRMTNVDAPDCGTKLAYFDKNELEDLPDFAGSGVDEMSLNYVASISAYIRQYQWTTSQATGTQIARIAVSPRQFFNTTSQGGQTLAHLAPVAYVSRFFSKWRGSFNFTFKLVKTEFHSGRLLVAFQMYDGNMGSYVEPNLTTSVWTHRQILDVRSGNEFTVNVPYSAFSQYKSTYGPRSIMGYLYIFVQNPLVAPATVSATVPILFEVAAGPDFEWAQACATSAQVTHQAIPQVGDRSDCQMVSSTIGGASDFERDISSRTCIGERVMSFRSLLKRFSRLYSRGSDASSNTTPFFRFTPFVIHNDSVSTVPALVSSDVQQDLFDSIAPCYALFRGSMRMKFVITDSSQNSNWAAFSYAYQPGVEINTDLTVGAGPLHNVNSARQQNRSIAFTNTTYTGGLEVEFPYYADYPSVCVYDMITTTGSASPNFKFNSSNVVPNTGGYLERYGAGGTGWNFPAVWRAIGEDASLGLFVSTVPLIGYDPDACE